jgi:AcrR family transcriptional regulator
MTAKAAVPRKQLPGRPKKASRGEIVRAALEVMEQEGFAALSMRSLARQLGINHATLYNYVDHIREVEQDALDELMKGVPMPDRSRPEPMRQQLIEHLLAVRRIQMVFPKFCLAPAGTPTWRLHMSCVARIVVACCDSDDQTEDVAIGYNALVGVIATTAERARVTGRAVPIVADMEAIAALPRDEFEPLFRPLRRKGGYSRRLTSFVYRLDYLIDRLLPPLPPLDRETLEAMQRAFDADNGLSNRRENATTE